VAVSEGFSSISAAATVANKKVRPKRRRLGCGGKEVFAETCAHIAHYADHGQKKIGQGKRPHFSKRELTVKNNKSRRNTLSTWSKMRHLDARLSEF